MLILLMIATNLNRIFLLLHQLAQAAPALIDTVFSSCHLWSTFLTLTLPYTFTNCQGKCLRWHFEASLTLVPLPKAGQGTKFLRFIGFIPFSLKSGFSFKTIRIPF